jgi:hypothetical protein
MISAASTARASTSRVAAALSVDRANLAKRPGGFYGPLRGDFESTG